MLRLVHPAPEGQPTRPPKRCRSAALVTTPEEKRHIVRALKNAARAYGSWGCLAEVMGTSRKSLLNVAFKPYKATFPFAVAIARATHTTVEAVLTGRLMDASRCPSCGSTIRDRAALAVSGGAR